MNYNDDGSSVGGSYAAAQRFHDEVTRLLEILGCKRSYQCLAMQLGTYGLLCLAKESAR